MSSPGPRTGRLPPDETPPGDTPTMQHQERLPKLNLFQISKHVANLFLVADKQEEWVREPAVRIVRHMFFLSIIALFVVNLAVYGSAPESLSNNPTFAKAFRVIMVIGVASIILLVFLLTHRHYRYLLLTGKDLHFTSIAFFYAAATVSFAQLYHQLYFLMLELFAYPGTPLHPLPNLARLGVSRFIFMADFVV